MKKTISTVIYFVMPLVLLGESSQAEYINKANGKITFLGITQVRAGVSNTSPLVRTIDKSYLFKLSTTKSKEFRLSTSDDKLKNVLVDAYYQKQDVEVSYISKPGRYSKSVCRKLTEKLQQDICSGSSGIVIDLKIK